MYNIVIQDLYENLLCTVDTAFLFKIKFYLSIYHVHTLITNMLTDKLIDYLDPFGSFSSMLVT